MDRFVVMDAIAESLSATSAYVPCDVTDDAFLDGRLSLLQPRHGYRAGLDAVLLAAAVPMTTGRAKSVLDVGAGVGTVGLCVAARVADAKVVLFEKDTVYANLAADNIARNGLSDSVRMVRGDVTAPWEALAHADLAPESFAHVLANPPFHTVGRGTLSGNALKAAAHAMAPEDLDHWVRFLARMTAPGGTVAIIQKTEALPALLTALGRRFGKLDILPIHSRLGEPANRVLIQGLKGSRAPLTLRPGFVVHDEGNAFTPAAFGILRNGLSFSQVNSGSKLSPDSKVRTGF